MVSWQRRSLTMGNLKLTFTLDEVTVAKLRQAASRLGKPQSEVVREAISEYSGRLGRLSDDEKNRLLAVFDELVPGIPSKSAAEVDRELEGIRTSRRLSARRRSGPAR